MFLSFFRSQFGCFHFSVFRLDNVVLAMVPGQCGGKNLFWSNLVPVGFEPRTFGVTPKNVTVSTNGPRLQVKPGRPGPLPFLFSNRHFFSPTDKKKSLTFFSKCQAFFLPPPPIGPRACFPASAVFRSCITGNSGHSGHVRFWQGKFSNRLFLP